MIGIYATGMDSQITPREIRDRATKAHSTLANLLSRAGVAKSTFWRWNKPNASEPHPVTVQKIVDALAEIEAEKVS
jgi:predicted transcriptional regulator